MYIRNNSINTGEKLSQNIRRIVMTKENCLETDSKKLMMMQYFRGEYAVVTAMNPGRLQDIAEQNLLKKMEDYQKSQDQLSRGKVNAKK